MRALPLLPLLLLAACYGGRVDAPSLQPRPEERQPIALPDDAVEGDAPLDPALAPRIATIVAGADDGHRRFEAERKATAAAIARARGQPEGSEAWIAAEEARSALAAARGPVSDAAAALDALRSDPAFAAAASRAAIDAAATHVEALAAAETSALPDAIR